MDKFFRYIIIGVFVALSQVQVRAQQLLHQWTEVDSITIERLLSNARGMEPGGCLPLYFARQFLGVPYVAHTLESSDGEERLTVNTRQLDCTTLVENVTALTLCAQRRLWTFRDFLNCLVILRYRDGLVGNYVSRMHYFTEWIVRNQERLIVTELQLPAPPFIALQTVDTHYMSTHASSYSALRYHPQHLPSIIEMENRITGLQFRYIPKSEVKNTPLLRRTISDGDIIAITCNKPGLDIAHLGFAVWRADGLHLLNASMLHHKVIEEPMTLGQYLSRHPSHTGIRVVRINR